MSVHVCMCTTSTHTSVHTFSNSLFRFIRFFILSPMSYYSDWPMNHGIDPFTNITYGKKLFSWKNKWIVHNTGSQNNVFVSIIYFLHGLFCACVFVCCLCISFFAMLSRYLSIFRSYWWKHRRKRNNSTINCKWEKAYKKYRKRWYGSRWLWRLRHFRRIVSVFAESRV